METGKLDPQGGANVVGTWLKVFERNFTAAVTSMTISDLDGNSHEVYKLSCRFIEGATTTISNYYGKFNNDGGANYGFQQLLGEGNVVTADRLTGDTKFFITTGGTPQNIVTAFAEEMIYCKTDFVRTLLDNNAPQCSGTNVHQIYLRGSVWKNTTDNITSLVITASHPNGIGSGSNITLYRKAG